MAHQINMSEPEQNKKEELELPYSLALDLRALVLRLSDPEQEFHHHVINSLTLGAFGLRLLIPWLPCFSSLQRADRGSFSVSI